MFRIHRSVESGEEVAQGAFPDLIAVGIGTSAKSLKRPRRCSGLAGGGYPTVPSLHGESDLALFSVRDGGLTRAAAPSTPIIE